MDKVEDGFTPGPWWACIGDDQPVPYYRGLVMYVSHDPKITVCTGTEGDKGGRTVHSSEWEANARLIAAAPDMYAALERLEAHCRILPPDMDEPGSPLAQARAALLLARKAGDQS